MLQRFASYCFLCVYDLYILPREGEDVGYKSQRTWFNMGVVVPIIKGIKDICSKWSFTLIWDREVTIFWDVDSFELGKIR